jgi:hypothetical protein
VEGCTDALVGPPDRSRWNYNVVGGCRIRTHLALPCNEMCSAGLVHYYGTLEAGAEAAAEVEYSHLSCALGAVVEDHDPRLLLWAALHLPSYRAL